MHTAVPRPKPSAHVGMQDLKQPVCKVKKGRSRSGAGNQALQGVLQEALKILDLKGIY